jgi:hypothetical protein
VHKSALLTGGKHLEAKVKWGFLTHRWFGGWEANPDPKMTHRALMTLDHEMCLFEKFSFLKLKVQAHQVLKIFCSLNPTSEFSLDFQSK